MLLILPPRPQAHPFSADHSEGADTPELESTKDIRPDDNRNAKAMTRAA
jgi:hypothetical protein